MVDIHDEGAEPVPVFVVFAQESDAGLLTPIEAGVTLLGLADFRTGRSEGRFLKKDFVAMRDVDVPVAAVEGFGPEECGGFRGAPGKIARTVRNTVNGNAIGERKRSDGVDGNVGGVGSVPDFNFLRETLVGDDVGIRLVDSGDEDVATVGSGVEAIVIGGLAEGSDGEGGGVDESELRKGEIIEKVLVSGGAEGVSSFVGAGLTFLAGGFLNTGTGEDF